MTGWHVVLLGIIVASFPLGVLVGKMMAGPNASLHDGATQRDHDDPWRAPVVDLGSFDLDTTIGGKS